MWIMTQGKKGIVNLEEASSICVSPNLGKKKSAIVAYPSNMVLGYYDNEKIALDEIENIYNSIIEDKKSYQMP